MSLSRDASARNVSSVRSSGAAHVQRRGPDRRRAVRARAGRASARCWRSIGLPVYDVRTMEDRIAASFAQTRGTMLLLLVTAALAAALAGVAIYGSIWYRSASACPEIGIRLALGATRASVFADVLRSAVRLTCIGAVLGTAGSIAAGRLISGLLFDTPATDPATHAVVVCAVTAPRAGRRRRARPARHARRSDDRARATSRDHRRSRRDSGLAGTVAEAQRAPESPESALIVVVSVASADTRPSAFADRGRSRPRDSHGRSRS